MCVQYSVHLYLILTCCNIRFFILDDFFVVGGGGGGGGINISQSDLKRLHY